MRQAVVLVLSLLGASCSAMQSKPEVIYPIRADTTALSFVEYPSPFSPMNECLASEYSNISCPFSLKRTISFQESFVEEERCSCFPEITRQRVPLAQDEKESYMRMAQAIHTLDDDGTSCVTDMTFTSLIIQGPAGDQRFLVTRSGWKGCGSSAAYVDEDAPHDLNQNLGDKVAPAPLVKDRALRKIYNEHHGFAIVFPILPGSRETCPWQRSYTYKADARSIEVSRCDGDRSLGSRTIQFDATENERLLNAVKALEAPTVEAPYWHCKSSSAITFELYQRDGTPDPYEFDGPVCNPRATPQPVDFRRRIFNPSAAGFIDLLEAYDNF